MTVVLLLAAGAVFDALFLLRSDRRQDPACLVFKSLASLFFVLLGARCFAVAGPGRFGALVLGGLFCGFAGDVLLGLRFFSRRLHDVYFVLGTLAFAAGHLLYISAILTASPGAWLPAIPAALAGLAVSWVYARARRVDAGRLLPLGTVYMAEVLYMASCAACGAALTRSPALCSFSLGGICFCFSDNLLAADTFGPEKRRRRSILLHALYYAAQVFIALSVLLPAA